MNPLDPKPTPFDLNWRMFGIHVRVHPGFWIFSAIFGWGMCTNPITGKIVLSSLLTWIGCTFFSVLIHELGHVVMGRLCGQKGNIVLHSFGGLAIGQYQLTSRAQQIAIFLAGPAAGLLLFAVIWLLVMPYSLAFLGMPDVHGPRLINRIDPVIDHPWLWRGATYLLLMNIMWNVLNLIPVIPMDGGQVVRAAMRGDVSPSGLRFALGMSFFVAGAIAVYSFVARGDPNLWYPGIPDWATLIPLGKLDPTFNMIFFAILAVQNFMMMQAVKRQEQSWDNDDGYQDPDRDRYQRRDRDRDW